jgi:hypothetical protein
MKVKIVLKNGDVVRDNITATSLNAISRNINKCDWFYTGKLLINISEIAYIEHEIEVK